MLENHQGVARNSAQKLAQEAAEGLTAELRETAGKVSEEGHIVELREKVANPNRSSAC